MVTWHGVPPPDPTPLTPMGWLRAAVRGAALLLVLGVCFPLLLLLRLPERLLAGAGRPVTPFITQGVCILALRILGLGHVIEGSPMRGAGAYVSNHVSWLDIFALNAAKRIYFVAKAEVAGWGGIGWLARGTGTVFVERKRGAARQQRDMFEARLSAGHQLMFFPEGTSSDGLRVLPFKSTLFDAFFTHPDSAKLKIQPVTLVYSAPEGATPAFYGWWGDMDMGPSLLQVLAQAPQGAVRVIYHPPLAVADYTGRKALAEAAEAAILQGLNAGLPSGPEGI